jgi:anti-sigma B factor antagonist
MTDNQVYPQGVIKSVRDQDKYVIMELTGEIDMKCSSKIKDKFKEIFAQKPKGIVVDMTKVSFMDSSGLAVLVGALKQTRVNSCKLKLAGLTEDVRSIFEICRLQTIFKIYSTTDEALSK